MELRRLGSSTQPVCVLYRLYCKRFCRGVSSCVSVTSTAVVSHPLLFVIRSLVQVCKST